MEERFKDILLVAIILSAPIWILPNPIFDMSLQDNEEGVRLI